MKEVLPTDLSVVELDIVRCAPPYGPLKIVDTVVLARLRSRSVVTEDSALPELTDKGRHLQWILSMGRQVD